MSESTAIADIRGQIQSQMANINKSVAPPSGRSISTKGKIFTLPDASTSQGPLELVVLDWRNFNAYYTTPYDPKDPKPPGCFAISFLTEDMAPHEAAGEKQSEACAGCDFNKWGSAPTGRGKACRNTVRLAVVGKDFTDRDEPMLLKVSPTGIKAWSGYVNNLQTIGKHPIEAIAKVSFKPDAAYPTLLFDVSGFHENLETAWSLREKAKAMLEAPPQGDT